MRDMRRIPNSKFPNAFRKCQQKYSWIYLFNKRKCDVDKLFGKLGPSSSLHLGLSGQHFHLLMYPWFEVVLTLVCIGEKYPNWVKRQLLMQKMTAWTYDGARVGSEFYRHTLAPPILFYRSYFIWPDSIAPNKRAGNSNWIKVLSVKFNLGPQSPKNEK